MKGEKVTRPPSAPPLHLIGVREASKLLDVRPAKLRRLCARGSVGYFRIGRSIKFSEGDLRAFLDRCRRPARGERALTSL